MALPPGLNGYVLGRQQQGHEQSQQLGMLSQAMQLQGALQQQQGVLQQRQRDEAIMAAASKLGPGASLEDLAKAIAPIDPMKAAGLMEKAQQQKVQESTMNWNNVRAGQADQQMRAQGGLAQLLSTGGYQGNAENPVVGPPDAVMGTDAAAIEALKGAEARGQPMSVNVPNPGTVSGLAALAHPSSITEILKQMSPTAKTAASSPLAKLTAERAALPPGHPLIATYDQAIEKASTHQPPVNVYAGSLTAGVDAQGKPVFVQPSGREGVPPRVVQGITPPAPAADRRQAEKDDQAAKGMEAANAQIDKLIAQVDADPTVVGTFGAANRIIEGVQGQIPGAPPVKPAATNFSSGLSLLQSTVYRDLVGSGQLSAGDYKHLGEILRGKGFLDSPQATKDGLEEVRAFLISKSKAPAGGRAPIPTNSVVNPTVNAKGWKLMTDAKGNKAYVGPNNEIEEVK